LKLLGYQVIEADSGPAALVVLDSDEKIDLIFSDIVMPGGMTGFELACQARERIPSLKVLLTSGYDAGLSLAQDTTGSDLRVLRKPYKQAELARALREVLLGN
jgi:CheY-like chemotaxis protein